MDIVVAVLAGFAFGCFVGPTVTGFITKRIVNEAKEQIEALRKEIVELLAALKAKL